MGGTLRRETVAADVKKVYLGTKSHQREVAGCSESVGPVITPSGKYNQSYVGTPVGVNLVGNCAAGAIDEVGEGDTLVFDGVLYYMSYVFV